MKSIGSSTIVSLLLLAVGAPGAAQDKPIRPNAVRIPATTSVKANQAVVLPTAAAKPQCPAPPFHDCPSPEGAKVLILKDASVQTTYTDGTVRLARPAGGGKRITYPDGTSVEDDWSGTTWRDKDGKVTNRTPKLHVEAEMPFAGPPDPPASGSQLDLWLQRHNRSLLTALQARMQGEDGGTESLNDYLARERGLGLYQQIAARTDLLQRLLAQP